MGLEELASFLFRLLIKMVVLDVAAYVVCWDSCEGLSRHKHNIDIPLHPRVVNTRSVWEEL